MHKKLLCILAIIVVFLSSCHNRNAFEKGIELSQYLIISASSDDLNPYVNIISIDETGVEIDNVEIYAPGAWITDISNDTISICGSSYLYLINTDSGDIIQILADAAVVCTDTYKDMIAFAVDSGMSSKACLLQLTDKKIYEQSDYICSDSGYAPIDILITKEGIIEGVAEALKHSIIKYDFLLNRIDEKTIPLHGVRFLTVDPDNLIICSSDKYYLCDSEKTLISPTDWDRFTIVDQFANGLIRTNYNEGGKEIYFEEIIDSEHVKSEKLLPIQNQNISVSMICKSEESVIALLENIKSGQTIKFYDVEKREFMPFEYAVKKSERILGSYLIN